MKKLAPCLLASPTKYLTPKLNPFERYYHTHTHIHERTKFKEIS